MLVTLLDMVMLVSPVQLEKAYLPMVVTLLGMTREPVSPEQPEKAFSPMPVTPLGIFMAPDILPGT
jgi:hypothetical protein